MGGQPAGQARHTVSGPRKPIITLKGRGAPKPPEKSSKPKAPPKAPRVRGPAYTPPRACEPYLEHFWFVMRASGRRPKVRHLTLVEAKEEARRIAHACPGTDVWILEVRTLETLRTEAPAAKQLAVLGPGPACSRGRLSARRRREAM
jgi:hypothetical protein